MHAFFGERGKTQSEGKPRKGKITFMASTAPSSQMGKVKMYFPLRKPIECILCMQAANKSNPLVSKTYVVEFEVETTCIANWFTLIISPPQGGCTCNY